MILKEIKIHNYRPFRDISIDFAHGDKNITIILGRRCAGNTTLINAIYWCLYGYEFRAGYEDLPICNIKTVHLAGYGDEIEVSVELIFDDDGKLLSFRRVRGFRKEFKKLILSSSHFEVREQIGNEIIISHEDQFAIDKKIPRKIMNHLLDIYNITSDEYEKKRILELIFFDYSQLNILKNVIHHLNWVKNFYISKIKKLDADISNDYESKKILEDKLHKVESKKGDSLKAETNKKLLLEHNLKFEEYRKKIEFCEESKRIAEDIFTQFNEYLIRKVETEINYIFPKNYLKDQVSEIFFNENYEFIIKNRKGCLLNYNDLSTGEQFLLNLSFIVSLNKIFGINLPIIIDLPVGFDMDTKIHMANYLIDLSQDNQIILLHTMFEDEFINIISKASKNYKLNDEWTDDGLVSKVVLDD